MNAQDLLREISEYCRQTGVAESTFGRRAVNDGKLAARLRNGGRITTETVDRVRAFIASHPEALTGDQLAVIERTRVPHAAPDGSRPVAATVPASDPQRN